MSQGGKSEKGVGERGTLSHDNELQLYNHYYDN